MSITVDDSMHSKVENNGILLGTQEPSRESKGAWGELYYYEGDLYFACYTDTQSAWLAFIAKLEDGESLSKYLSGDELDKAEQKLKEIQE